MDTLNFSLSGQGTLSMNSKLIESDPRFVPHPRRSRAGGWTRLVVLLLVLAAYVAIALALDEAIQVSLVVLAPLALVVSALALRITDRADPD
jgi:hypothetical protein